LGNSPLQRGCEAGCEQQKRDEEAGELDHFQWLSSRRGSTHFIEV
jgi:hypothetical protein